MLSENGSYQNDKLTIAAWNINGLRAKLNKGVVQKYISNYSPEILCLK